MKTPNVLGTPEYPNLPKRENDSVGTISRDNIADWAWLAGIFDGEGCVGMHGNKARKGVPQLRLFVRNCCPFMVRRIAEIY